MPKTRTQATCEGHPRLMVWGFSASWMDFPRTEICCEASFYLLGDIHVFYTTPPLPDAVSILMNMQPFYSLKQGKKNLKALLTVTSKGTPGSEGNLNLNCLTCFLLQEQMFLLL